ncbi:MAG: hypothetical protein PHQ62_03170 [Clostridia bacterium]|nr:hypothetical protein [Clostridia bacterium]
MSKSFFDYGDTKVKEDSNSKHQKQDNAQKSSDDNNKNIEDMVGKYKNMSKNDLMSSFFQEAQKQKQNGTLDVAKLEKAIDNMGSYLSAEQKKNIKELLNKIK